MDKNVYKNLVANANYGILDQIFSSGLIFGINFYFAYNSKLNSVGIFALIFSTIGISQVLQQAILERPLLIRQNIFKLRTIIKRFSIVSVVLLFSILFTYNAESQGNLTSFTYSLFLPWIFLGVIQLLFNLQRIYFYSVSKEKYAFNMSFISLILIFVTFLIFRNNLTNELIYLMLTICIIKLLVGCLYYKHIDDVDYTNLELDGNYKQYIYLFIISLSVFLRTRFPVFYLTEFSLLLIGVYEMFRSSTEILLLPFRPVSQTLMSFFSNKQIKGGQYFLKIILTTAFTALITCSIFYLLADFVFNIFNIEVFSEESIKTNIVIFCFFTIITVPINSNLIALKNFRDGSIIKTLPLIYMVIAILNIQQKNMIQEIIQVITISSIIEFSLAVLLSYKYFKKSTVL